MSKTDTERENRVVAAALAAASADLFDCYEDVWGRLAAAGRADERGSAEWRRVTLSIAEQLRDVGLLRNWIVQEIGRV